MTQKDNVVDLAGRPHETSEQVLERLFKEHSAALRAFLWARVKSEAELEDIVQEVFARLSKLDNLAEKLSANRQGNRAFILTTANNYLVDQERRKIIERHYHDTELRGSDHLVVEINPETITAANQELEVVKRAISNLEPGWRRAFLLSRFDHKSYQQIAVEMNISVKTVEKYITRALVKIRDATAAAHRAGGK